MAYYGRKVAFYWDGVRLPGIREKGLTINGEAVNVSADEDSGIQMLLDEDAEASIELSISGLDESATLRTAKLSGSVQGTAKLVWPTGEELEWTANLAGLEFGMTYNDATTVSGTLQSTGTWTHTPASSS